MLLLTINQQAHYKGIQTKAANENPVIFWFGPASFYPKGLLNNTHYMYMQEAVGTQSLFLPLDCTFGTFKSFYFLNSLYVSWVITHWKDQLSTTHL